MYNVVSFHGFDEHIYQDPARLGRIRSCSSQKKLNFIQLDNKTVGVIFPKDKYLLSLNTIEIKNSIENIYNNKSLSLKNIIY